MPALSSKNADEQKAVKARFRPTVAWLSVTGRCNLLCAHCSRFARADKVPHDAPDMTEELFSRLEAEIFPNLKLCWFGGNSLGEQLFCRKWDSFFERTARFPMAVHITTNGTLLTEERINSFVERPVTLFISLEGARAETYEQVRGSSFAHLMEKVERLCRLIQEKGSRSRVRFNFTAMSFNLPDLPTIIETCASLGAEGVNVTHFAPCQEEYRYLSLVYHQQAANEYFNRARSQAKKSGVRLWIPENFPVVPISHDSTYPEKDNTRKKDRRCVHPWSSVSINEKGEVMPCCASQVLMGDLTAHSMEEIWNGRKYRKLRSTVNSPRPILTCRSCYLRGTDIRNEHASPNDPCLLLARIGPGKGFDFRAVFYRRLHMALSRSQWGGKLVPILMKVYRRSW